MPVVEQYSIDEFFADLSGFKADNEAYAFATELQAKLLANFKLPASIGISKSKWSAKFLTDLAKPFGIKFEPDIKKALIGVDISNFPGIGKKLEIYLRTHNINTLDELINKPCILENYAKFGKKLYTRIIGEDAEAVEENKELKSHAISKSFSPISDAGELKRRIKILSRHLCVWINKGDFHPRRLEISLKHSGKIEKITLNLNQPFFEKNLIETAIKGLEKLLKNSSNVYFLGLSISGLDKFYEENIFLQEQNAKSLKLSKTISSLRERFGIDSIKFGEL